MYSFGRTLSFAILLLTSQFALAENVLVLSNGATNYPMHGQNNSGIAEAILSEALRRINYKLEIRLFPNERSLINSNRGLVDGETQRIAGLEKKYPNLIRVPEKTMDWEFVAFSKKKIDMTRGWSSLVPYETSYITGWKIFEFNVPKNVRVTRVRDPDGLFTLLNHDRSDIALFERWEGMEIIKKNKYKDIKPLSPALASREMFTYLHKKNAKLVPLLAKALKDMKNDGTYARLHKQILGPLEK